MKPAYIVGISRTHISPNVMGLYASFQDVSFMSFRKSDAQTFQMLIYSNSYQSEDTEIGISRDSGFVSSFCWFSGLSGSSFGAARRRCWGGAELIGLCRAYKSSIHHAINAYLEGLVNFS